MISHRHPRAARREDPRRQPRRAAEEGLRGRASRPHRARRGRRRRLARAGQAVPRDRREPRGHGPLRPRDAQDVLDVVEVGLGGENVTTDHRRPGALSRSRCGSNATSATTSSASAKCSSPRPRGKCIPLGQIADDPPRHRPERNRQRERPPPRLRAGQCAGPRPRRLRRGSEGARRQGDRAEARAGHDHRIQRRVREPDPRSADAGSSSCPPCSFIIFLLLYIVYRLGEGSRARHPRRARSR